MKQLLILCTIVVLATFLPTLLFQEPPMFSQSIKLTPYDNFKTNIVRLDTGKCKKEIIDSLSGLCSTKEDSLVEAVERAQAWTKANNEYEKPEYNEFRTYWTKDSYTVDKILIK